MPELTNAQFGQVILRTVQSAFAFSGIGLVMSLLKDTVAFGKYIYSLFSTLRIVYSLMAVFAFGLVHSGVSIALVLGYFSEKLGAKKYLWEFLAELTSARRSAMVIGATVFLFMKWHRNKIVGGAN